MPKSRKLSLCQATKKEREKWLHCADRCPHIELDRFSFSDLEALSHGLYTPLKGFMTKKDYLNVLKQMRLATGEIFALPITLRVPKEKGKELKEGGKALLYYQQKPVAGLEVEELFTYDKRKEAKAAFGTSDDAHPGVARLYAQGDLMIGGRVYALQSKFHKDFARYRLTPLQAREAFQKRGWKTVVGFQTRNPIHRAHEYLIKTALEMVDGAFIHPLMGETKKGDISAKVRMQCYQTLLRSYFPKERVLLSLNPCSMRYAGPREAVFHAIVRRNYGCTHFIVGRDHAGVGNYYGSYDAQKLLAQLDYSELGITPLFFEHAFFCQTCDGMATEKTCPHSDTRLFLSGTKVRQRLSKGRSLPTTFTRKEVAAILVKQAKRGKL